MVRDRGNREVDSRVLFREVTLFVMTSTLALALTLGYSWQPGMTHTYTMNATFDGFLPILGGNTGVVDAMMKVRVDGASKDGANLRATSEVVDFTIGFNGARLPLGLSNVTEFFPKTTATFGADGTIVKTDAPDRRLPIRLPGLDVKRFPDITYLPIQFPTDGVEVGTAWQFAKPFDGAPLQYDCKVVAVRGNQVLISVNLKQTQEYLENEALEVVTNESDAAARVKAELVGSGTVVLNTERGVADASNISFTTVSRVTTLSTNETTDRRMVTNFVVTREGATAFPVTNGTAPPPSARPTQEKGGLMRFVPEWAQPAVATAGLWARWAERQLVAQWQQRGGARAWTDAFSRVMALWKQGQPRR